MIDPEAGEPFPIRPEIGAAIVRWAALGDLPRQRFPELDDPYEPMLALFDPAAVPTRLSHPGFIELGSGTFPIRSLAERAVLDPVPIDAASLDALDGVS